MPKNEIATTGTSAIVTVPDYIPRSTQGTEDMGREDIIIPRIAIAQANTPQCKRADPAYIQGLVEGMLFNTVTGKIYGDKLTGVPLFFFKQRIKFGEYGKGEGIQCQSLNGKDGGRLHPSDCATCPHAQFNNDNPEDSRPECDQLYNYMILLPDEWAVLSNRSTNIRAAKQFNAQVRLARIPMYGKNLEISSIGKTQKGNSFYGVVLKWNGFVSKELFQSAEKAFIELKQANIKVDTTGMEAEDEEDTVFAPESM